MSMKHALLQQSEACARLGSPFMGQMLFLLADSWQEDSAIGAYCNSFDGEIGASGASLPLRLTGALHALVLTQKDADLASVYPPETATDVDLERVVRRALLRHEAFILDWMKSPPQTNEVRRCAVLIPAAHWIAARYGLPFVTSELGASAGLNLAWDSFAVETAGPGRLGPAEPALALTPDWQGRPVPPAGVRVAERAGVDLNPLDPTDPDQRLRLLAYLWPDQPERAALTRAAIAVRAGQVEKADAIDWLEKRLATPRNGHLHLIYHTIAWQYFPADGQARGTALIEAAGKVATADAPLAWLRFEADGQAPGAAITLRLWPGDLHLTLGRADFHGRWVHWTPQQM